MTADIIPITRNVKNADVAMSNSLIEIVRINGVLATGDNGVEYAIQPPHVKTIRRQDIPKIIKALDIITEEMPEWANAFYKQTSDSIQYYQMRITYLKVKP